jgi:hypothetical protein
MLDAALPSTHFIFASNFHNGTLPAPVLTVTGPYADAALLLQLIGCCAPRSLAVLDPGSSGFFAITEQLRPVLLLDWRHLNRASRHLLSGSCIPGACVVSKNSLVNAGLAKAIYLGPAPDPDFAVDFSLNVHLPSTNHLSMLDDTSRQRIMADFLPKFLEYRMRGRSAVRDSTFDIPELQSENRMLAKVLGASIVNDKNIQAGIRDLLRDREDQIREARFTDPTSVIIEVLFAQCHGHEQHDIRVGELAEKAMIVLKSRGELAELKPRRVGAILTTLKLPRKRRRILLETAARRRIHHLVRDHSIDTIQQNPASCAFCLETLGKVATATDKRTCTGEVSS